MINRINALGSEIIEIGFPGVTAEQLVNASGNYFDTEFMKEMRELYHKKYGIPMK